MASPDLDMGAGFGQGPLQASSSDRDHPYPPDFFNQAPHVAHPIEGCEDHPDNTKLLSHTPLPSSGDIFTDVPTHKSPTQRFYPRTRTFAFKPA